MRLIIWTMALNRQSGDKKTMTIIGQMAIKENSNLSWWSGRVGVFYGTDQNEGGSLVEKDFCQSIANVVRLKCNLN